MPLLARDNNSTLLPLDSTMISPDLSVRTSGQTASSIYNTHRVVLASASVLLESVFRDCCPCEQMTIILPESFDNILARFITWLYTGVVQLGENEEVLKWNELLKLLGIGVENDRICIEKFELKAPSKETDAERLPVKPRVKSENLLVKSLKALTLNDSKEYPRKAFYDADIFTSDDDSYAGIDEDGKLGDPVNPISYNAKSTVDSCVQCDLSIDEHENDSTNDLEFVIVHKSDSNETNSSSSDFLDATMSPTVEKSSSQLQPEEVFGKSLYHNETVYQDCNEEVEDNKPEGDTIDEDSTDKFNVRRENLSTDMKSGSNETNSKKKDDETIEDIGFDGCVDDNEIESLEEKDDEQEFDIIDSGEIDIKRGNESIRDVSGVIGSHGKKSDTIIEEDGFENDSLSGNETESYEEEESYEDPSWNESCSDFSDQSDDEVKVSKKAANSTQSIPLGDLTNINLSTVDTTVLGAWLSDSGPVKIPPRCLCKGTCVRNCSCRTAGTICTSRCSCKPSKCKLRAEAAEGSYPVQTTRNIQTDAENVSIAVGNSFSDPHLSVTDSTDDVDQSQLTPSCLSSTFFSSNSTLMSTTAKKKKKKLFTESIGPQEM